VGEYAQGDSADGYIVSGAAAAAGRPGSPSPIPSSRPGLARRISFKLGVWDEANKTYDSERLKVLNVPVLKTHSGYGVTASVKHYMGVVSDRPQPPRQEAAPTIPWARAAWNADGPDAFS